MVKRYDLWTFYDEWQEDESDDGEWVKYADHAAELTTLRAENERLREEMHHVIVRNEFLANNYGLTYERQEQAKEALK